MKTSFFEDLSISCPDVVDEELEKLIARFIVMNVGLRASIIVLGYYGIETEPKILGTMADSLTISKSSVIRLRNRALLTLKMPHLHEPLVMAITRHILLSKGKETRTLLEERDRLANKVVELEAEVTRLQTRVSELYAVRIPIKTIVTGDMGKPIESLGLNTRTINCLRAENILYVGDLVQMTQGELLKVPKLGRRSFLEIVEYLAFHNFGLGTKAGSFK